MFDGTLGEIVTSKIQLIVIPLYLSFILLESILIRYFKAHGSTDAKESLFNISIGIMSVPVNLCSCIYNTWCTILG